MRDAPYIPNPSRTIPMMRAGVATIAVVAILAYSVQGMLFGPTSSGGQRVARAKGEAMWRTLERDTRPIEVQVVTVEKFVESDATEAPLDELRQIEFAIDEQVGALRQHAKDFTARASLPTETDIELVLAQAPVNFAARKTDVDTGMVPHMPGTTLQCQLTTAINAAAPGTNVAALVEDGTTLAGTFRANEFAIVVNWHTQVNGAFSNPIEAMSVIQTETSEGFGVRVASGLAGSAAQIAGVAIGGSGEFVQRLGSAALRQGSRVARDLATASAAGSSIVPAGTPCSVVY